jgi:hypothetical protein
MMITYIQAKVIVWNYKTYDPTKAREAAVVILSTLDAKAEDFDQASHVLYGLSHASNA